MGMSGKVLLLRVAVARLRGDVDAYAAVLSNDDDSIESRVFAVLSKKLDAISGDLQHLECECSVDVRIAEIKAKYESGGFSRGPGTGSGKIYAVKALREVQDMDLLPAKNLVESWKQPEIPMA
jgi:hypothetical protein